MYRSRNVVVVIPAGRKKYLELLVPQIVSSKGLIDRIDFWLNTGLKEDRKCVMDFVVSDPHFMRIVEVDVPENDKDPERRFGDGNYGKIFRFFPYCREGNTIYVRLDDDVVWLEENFFENLLDYRIDNPDLLIVSANVINNWGIHYDNGLEIHRRFIDDFNAGDIEKYRDVTNFKRNDGLFAVNCISWTGDLFGNLNVCVGDPEEHWLNSIGPQKFKLKNGVCPGALAAHLAFKHQRKAGYESIEKKLLADYDKLVSS